MSGSPRLRTALSLIGAAVGVSVVSFLLAGGLPLLAAHALTGRAYLLLAMAAGSAATLVAILLLLRLVGRPIERLLEAGNRLALTRAGEVRLPVLGEGDVSLARAGVAFERLVGELAEERAQLDAKVEELTRANGELEQARASLVRSERLATLGRLAAGIAHEVGNPLGAITGYVELARSRLPPATDPELPGALDRIAQAAQRIDRTVHDLLDLARPVPLALALIQLQPVVEAALRLARVQSRFRSVTVETTLPAELPRVWADEHHLAQVLLNLLLNAGDAMGGAGQVHIQAEAMGDDRVALVVSDEGPGIAAAALPHLFEPFFTTKAPGEGTGLGLAVSQRVMETFGGEISARNGEGGGAEFRLSFQARAVDEEGA